MFSYYLNQAFFVRPRKNSRALNSRNCKLQKKTQTQEKSLFRHFFRAKRKAGLIFERFAQNSISQKCQNSISKRQNSI